MSDSRTRRRVLRESVASIAGLSAVSMITKGQSTTSERINKDFDPNNESEVKRFVSKLLEREREKQEEIYSTLSNEQQDVVAEGLSLEKIKTTVTHQAESPTASNTNSYSATFVQEGQSTLGENIWNYHHEIEYDYTGSGCPIDVTDVSNEAWATNISLGWSYDGDVSDSTDINNGGCGDSDEARSLKQGKFSYALNGTVYTANPMSRLAGSTKYDFGAGNYLPDVWVVEQECDYCNGIVGDG